MTPHSHHVRVSWDLQKEDTGSSAVVPIPTVHSRTLSKVLEYCKKHVSESDAPSEANGDNDADAAADSSAADKSLDEWDKVSICSSHTCHQRAACLLSHMLPPRKKVVCT